MERLPANGFHRVLTAWDPMDSASVADPYPAFALARREAPVFYNDAYRSWVVAGYDEVVAVLQDTDRFSSRQSIGSGAVPADLAHLMPSGFVWDHPSLVNNDPPSYVRVRKIADAAWRMQHVRRREPVIRELVTEIIDTFADRGEVEFMSGFAEPLPIIALCNFLGIPTDVSAQVIEWSDATIVMMDPNLPEEKRRELARGQADFRAFCEAFIDDRRRHPGDDLVSGLITAEVEGVPALDPPELISTFSHFILGGNLTTRRLLGNMMLRLVEHPDQLDAVRADTALASRAVEETLRHTTSVKCLARTTLDAVDIGGVTIPAGENVLVMWASANHDESRFEHPEEFDIFRQDVHRHLAFSKHAHVCIGAPFARVEAKVALEELVTRLPRLRRANDEPLQWMPLANHMGLARLDLAWNCAVAG